MMMPSLKEILFRHPYLIPVLLVILGFVCLGYMCQGITQVFRNATCPGCPNGKRFCLVACEEVSRGLDEMERRREHHA